MRIEIKDDEAIDEGERTRIRKIIFEIYMSLKEIYHQHIFHKDKGHHGADSLLKLEDANSEKEAVCKIAIQHTTKVALYLKIFEEYIQEVGSDNRLDKIDRYFYDLYAQARGEFLYGLSFMEIFAPQLEERAKDHSNILLRGIRGSKILYSIFDDFVNMNLNRQTNEISKHTNDLAVASERTNIEVKNLTYYVLAFAIIAVLVPLFNIFKEYLPTIAHLFDFVLFAIFTLILILMIKHMAKRTMNWKMNLNWERQRIK
ncbi:MAG: hypothetical protein LBG62_06065 [Candidatus Methanoplasma sp.]|nr:hypothetical protein [Candidatus Methanoplasma sp.]